MASAIRGFRTCVLATGLAACGGGGSDGVHVADTTPDAFSFADQQNVAATSVVVSAPVTISGIDAPATVTVMNGRYSIGCNGTFTAATGTINNGGSVCVRHTSAAAPGTATDTTLTVGGVTDIFTSTTAGGMVALGLQRAYSDLTFSQPVALLQAPDDDTRWFVVEQAGIVRVFDNDAGVTAATTFIDITDRVVSGGETGLLGMAFAPNFAANGHVFLSYTGANPLTSVIVRMRSTDGGQTLNPATETVILTVAQPYSNHNGGNIAFGPDGLLYVGFGDGGSGNDPDNNAQNTTNLLGSMLRINVGTLPYQIPATNPFAGNALCGDGGVSPGGDDCPEIYAWGLRNPWRWSFDRATGDLWAGDVGQNDWEEVDRIVIGGNYGWRDREGAHCNPTLHPGGGCSTAGVLDPQTEYGHSVGSSITGGYVYRGTAIPALVGSYLFADFVTGRIFRLTPGGTDYEDMPGSGLNISSFGEAADGELYALDYGGGIYRIVAAP